MVVAGAHVDYPMRLAAVERMSVIMYGARGLRDLSSRSAGRLRPLAVNAPPWWLVYFVLMERMMGIKPTL